jgi:hypothetical protein
LLISLGVTRFRLFADNPITLRCHLRTKGILFAEALLSILKPLTYIFHK